MKACSAEMVARSIWAKMEQSSTSVTPFESNRALQCQCQWQRDRREVGTKKHFKFNPQTKDGGAAEGNETGEERENKDRLFHHL